MPDLLAGAATAHITPPASVLMDGYGARAQSSQGVHDELVARALVLEQGDETAAIISCDLLGMHPARGFLEGHGLPLALIPLSFWVAAVARDAPPRPRDIPRLF